MSRAISLVFSLAIAVVVAGSLSMPAEAQPGSRQPAMQANDRTAAGSSGAAHQPAQATPRWTGPDGAGRSVRQAGTTGSKGLAPAHAVADRRPGGPPTGVKMRANQDASVPAGHRPDTPPAHARGPGSSEQPGGVPGRPRDEVAGGATPAPDAMAPQPDAAEAAPAAGPASAPQPAATPTSSTSTGAATSPSTAGAAAGAAVGPALRAPLAGAWFGHQIHGLLSSPPVLPRPQLGPFQPPTAPTAFSLLFGLLGAWYILQRVAWNRLGHVPLTSPPGPARDVAHG